MSKLDAAIGGIFKAYDVRGKVGDELNPDVVNRIGQGLASFIASTEGNSEGENANVIAVGRDMRPDSEELSKALIEGIRAQGFDVWDIGEITTDMIYFVVGHYKLAGGAVVTASHNPGEYNGIKICREDAKPIGQESGLLEIRDAVLAGEFPTGKTQGSLQTKDVVEGWIQHTLSFIDTDKLTEMRLAVDAGNGMAGAIFPELEPYVPWEVTEMYFELDGTFPNHEANPMKFETLADMIQVIRQNKLDGGVAFDGDGDRAFLVDETGTVLSGGVMSAMIADYFLKLHPGSAIVYDIRNSRTVPEVVEAAGGKPVIERVGHAFLKQKMREVNSPFGGEASGHFYFRDNWYGDSGLIGAVIGLYVASLSGKKLSELRKQYSHYADMPETNFKVDDKEAVLKRIEEGFKDFTPNKLDGVTYEFPDKSWFNVRTSNTEPLIRLNAEAKTEAELKKLVDKVTGLINGK
jgi:phosphomannomutase